MVTKPQYTGLGRLESEPPAETYWHLDLPVFVNEETGEHYITFITEFKATNFAKNRREAGFNVKSDRHIFADGCKGWKAYLVTEEEETVPEVRSDIRRTHGSGNQVRCYRDDHGTWEQVMNRRRDALKKHGVNSMEALNHDDMRWWPILMEEIGELAHEFTYDASPGDYMKKVANRRNEAMDVLAVVSAYVAAIDDFFENGNKGGN